MVVSTIVALPEWAPAPGQRKLMEIWLDFRDGRYFAVVDERLPEGIGERVCAIAEQVLDAALDDANDGTIVQGPWRYSSSG